jgi:hypothetical protein
LKINNKKMKQQITESKLAELITEELERSLIEEGLWGDIRNTAKGAVKTVGNAVGGAANTLYQGAKGAVQTVGNAVSNVGQSISTGAIQAKLAPIQGLIWAAAKADPKAYAPAQAAFKQLQAALTNASKVNMQQIRQAAGNSWGNVKNAANNMAKGVQQGAQQTKQGAQNIYAGGKKIYNGMAQMYNS